MINRIKETVSMIKGLDKETLEGIRYTLIFFIVIDIIGFYWYMGWKKFGIALMLVSCVILAFILILERRFPPDEDDIKESKGGKMKHKKEKKQEESKEKEEPEEEKKEDNSLGLGIDTGLPDSEEYNKRLEKAISS